MGLALNLTGTEIDSSIVEFENLLQIRPVEKIFEHTAGGEGAGFVPTVTIGVLSEAKQAQKKNLNNLVLLPNTHPRCEPVNCALPDCLL